MFYSRIIFSLILLIGNSGMFSCGCQKFKITHLDFLDNLGISYNIMDTSQNNPLKVKSLYFIINERSLKCIEFSKVAKYIREDSLIKNEVSKKYFELSLFFYRESANTEQLLRFRSSKFLSLANDDIVVEYLWSKGEPSDTLYYEQGQIKGSEKIKLK